MKRLILALAMGALVFSLFRLSQASFQTPDPRDSVIVESKTINPGVGKPAARVRIFITNKDTLAGATMGLIERSLTGGAYMTLAWPRTFDSVITRLTPSLPSYRTFNGGGYDGISPDTIVFGSYFDGESNSGYEPPNPVRKPFWEIKFDTIWLAAGTFELDSLRRIAGALVRYTNFTSFEGERAYDVDVNFVKGIITVAPPPPPPPCGDFNGDGSFSTADIVDAVNCLFDGEGGCGAISTAADIVRMLNSLFSSPGRFPLLPPPPC